MSYNRYDLLVANLNELFKKVIFETKIIIFETKIIILKAKIVIFGTKVVIFMKISRTFD